MKKLIIINFLIFLSFVGFSQQINKELVVVEIKTGTWCQYCPGAAMGADELVANFGDAVAVIEHHGGDTYENDYSLARISYYGSSGYPTAYFNGGDAFIGGDHDVSMYPYYLPIYNSAIAVLTSFDISMEVTPVNDNTYNVTVTVNKVDDYAGTNLVAHLAITESQIEETWQGMEELNFVNRAMFPNASGTLLDFGSGNQQIINYTVNIENEWVTENCELVAFVQDNSTKEILQGTKESLNIPIGQNNAMLKQIEYPYEGMSICEDVINPVITIKNRGSENLLSLDIEYEINLEGVQTYSWTGDLAFGESTEIILEDISYTPAESNLLNIELTNPNGTNDDDLSNNIQEVTFNKSAESTTITFLEINPAGSFGLPWTLKDSQETIVYNGNASGPNIVYEVFELILNECYMFTITSTMGNGIPGEGYFPLTDSEDGEVYYGTGDSFTDEFSVPFKITAVTDIAELEKNNISIFPIPALDQINIISENQEIDNISIFDISGKLVMSKNLSDKGTTIKIDLNSFNPGIYFVQINTKEGTITKKISVIR